MSFKSLNIFVPTKWNGQSQHGLSLLLVFILCIAYLLVRVNNQAVIMHDWWMALIAVSEGIVCGLNAKTVKYRQHDNNDTGAKQWGLGFIIKTIRQGFGPQLQNLIKTRVQAEALVGVGVLSDVNRRIVRRYISLFSSNWFKRRIDMLRMRFLKYGVIRNIAMFLRI